MDTTIPNPDASHDFAAWAIVLLALGQFMFFTWLTLDQPIIDLWGFRPAQTAIPVPYILREGHWLATALPIFGNPWVVPFEFPFFQWCVVLLAWLTGASVDACGRLVSAFFAVVTLWPASLLAKSFGLGRRVALIAGALWLMAPVVMFFGRSFLIETTVVFLSAGWLAFYVRTLSRGSYIDGLAGLVFGLLAALVKITAFAGFVVVGFIYTCAFVWQHRERLEAITRLLLLAGGTVLVPAMVFMSWGDYADSFLAQNPLASLLRTQNLLLHFFGVWSDRSSVALWDWTIRLRALPETLGGVWYVALYGLARMGVRNRLFPMTLTLLVGYLSGFLFFPQLHMAHHYYQVENAMLLCASAAIITEALLRRGRTVEGYLVLAALAVGQLSTFYTSNYVNILRDDLHKHPYYQTGLVLREVTPPDSVIVAFGLGYGADLSYFADRRGIVLANWFPIPAVRQVVFDQRNRWFSGRKVGAIVDCSVYESQVIGPELIPIRDELRREFSGKTIEVNGSFYGATLIPSKCDVFLPR